MMIKRLPYLLLLLFFLLPGHHSLWSQQKDFSTWYEAELSGAFRNKMGWSAELEQRFMQNSTQYDRTQLTLVAKYDLLDYLRISGGMRGLMASDPEGNVDPRFRLHADAMGRYSVSEFDFSLRMRFQYGFEELIYFGDIQANTFVNRLRLKAAYHFFGTRFGAFATAETWGLITDLSPSFLKRMRYSAGVNYALNFKSEIGLRYIIEQEQNQVNPMQAHILVLGYSYSL